MTLILIDNLDSFTYNLVQQLGALVTEPIHVFRNNAVDIDTLHALNPSGIVLSPGPGHPKNPKDMGICQTILEQYHRFQCPLLGVCLGHQAIAHHFGGTVIPAPVVMHGKTSTLCIESNNGVVSPLFEAVDQTPESLTVMRYHSLIADKATLPPVLNITATSTPDGLIMALEHRLLPIYGVQFHPESIGSPQGTTMMHNFIRLTQVHRFNLQQPLAQPV